MKAEFVIGVDVGTGSVRAGIFDLKGKMVGQGEQAIQMWRPKELFVEQSSDDIWRAARFAVREALRSGSVQPSTVIGISFDATCSLVALDRDDKAVSVSPTGRDEQNVIVWMDHRAVKQAERINRTKADVLKYVGGRISPEMQMPKLLWLKENLPRSWQRAARFLDLADFMTYRATGKDVRSLCTTVCKWTYRGKEGTWDRGFFRKIGVEELLHGRKIGEDICPMGSLLGPLTPHSARELGLTTETKVAVGIIDAHAGGIGVVGLQFRQSPDPRELETFLALIGGTSSCHMAVSRRPKFIEGVWGPYYSAMIPGMWLTEGGQSATGSLVDYIIRESSAYDRLQNESRSQGISVYELLNDIVKRLQRSEGKGTDLTERLHVLPYFLGNRSPRANPHLRGVVSGLTLDASVESVARRYYATIQAIAYGTRHIIETLNRSGYRIRRIHACGGGTKNPLWLQEHADVTGCEILLPKEPEAVLLGTAILAAVGAGKYESILEASARMSAPGRRYLPRPDTKSYHARKYRAFHRMYEHWRELEGIMRQG